MFGEGQGYSGRRPRGVRRGREGAAQVLRQLNSLSIIRSKRNRFVLVLDLSASDASPMAGGILSVATLEFSA